MTAHYMVVELKFRAAVSIGVYVNNLTPADTDNTCLPKWIVSPKNVAVDKKRFHHGCKI
jgi:hypothetical protein